ncbi:hypothetical protein QHC70_003691 [Citrobacter freundii]|nr:hypothetical protein [Citrobacter freundii]ELQ7945343.1 hypothetical protein [Citrobacter freundii]ELQ7995470.1 hypothetical protein [Citrobacter freundii]
MTTLSSSAGPLRLWFKKEWEKKLSKKDYAICGLILISLIGADVLHSLMSSTSSVYADYGMLMQKQSLEAPVSQGAVVKVDSFGTAWIWKYANILNRTNMRIDGGSLHTTSGKNFNFRISGISKMDIEKAQVFTIPVKIDKNDPVLKGSDNDGKSYFFENEELTMNHIKICFVVNGSVTCGLGTEKGA